MGYRSKVIIGVKEGKLSNEFDEILKKHDFNPNKNTDYLKVGGTSDGMKTYLFDYVKWYSSDDWCKDIMDYLDNLDDDGARFWGGGEMVSDVETDEECLVFCVGIGEEGEIHSEIGDYWEYVDVIRDINLIE